ncbi:hypothetical protein T4A_12594 [Trichinella pseudospiralis]|uniref:Uncharacterized protein n=1 Tax=Trichinella pseudospiralis TaxID=6337 RepID=A0A0V1ALU1_TRIPS|nr:hypothetical protein T4A_12594 [Trichinella pseudospiralis]
MLKHAVLTDSQQSRRVGQDKLDFNEMINTALRS